MLAAQGASAQWFGGRSQVAQQPGWDQTKPPLTAAPLPSPGTPRAPNVEVPWNTTPPQPGAAQPTLPSATPAWPDKPTSPVIERIVREKQPPLDVRKGARRVVVARPRPRYARPRYAGRDSGRVLERPALAGVVLVAPLVPPPEGPHVTVPTAAYPVETVVARFTTPPPPIRCHPTRRDPYAPDPHLYKEVPVQCEPEED